MCGIVGIFCKSESAEDHLGEYVSAMLDELADRGPDSAGVALYRDRVDDGTKLSLRLAVGRDCPGALANVRRLAGAITPVPGGVGPSTIACLLRNTVLAAYEPTRPSFHLAP